LSDKTVVSRWLPSPRGAPYGGGSFIRQPATHVPPNKSAAIIREIPQSLTSDSNAR